MTRGLKKANSACARVGPPRIVLRSGRKNGGGGKLRILEGERDTVRATGFQSSPLTMLLFRHTRWRAWPLAARAQQPGKVYRVVIMSLVDPIDSKPVNHVG
jgi:hypothetical protein